MRPGELRRQVQIQQRNSTQDSFGQRVQTWATVATTWADIQPLSGRELETAQAVRSEVTHTVVIRYRPGVTAAMRVVYQGRYFNVLSVIDVDTRHKVMQLLCSEGLNDGQ